MPFYDALKFILNTATSKVRRKCWEPGYYLSRGFMNDCMSVVLVHRDEEGKCVYERFVAKPEDMIAEDWCICV